MGLTCGNTYRKSQTNLDKCDTKLLTSNVQINTMGMQQIEHFFIFCLFKGKFK